MKESLKRSIILKEPLGRRELTEKEQANICVEVAEAISRYAENWGATYQHQKASLLDMQRLLAKALATIVSNEGWIFDPEDECAPANPDALESIEEWILSETNDCFYFFDNSNDWKTKSLWQIFREYQNEIDQLNGTDSNRYDAYDYRPIDSNSRIPPRTLELVDSLINIWLHSVDRDLRLPSKDPDADNPFLRFMDSILEHVCQENRPSKKTILNYTYKFARPFLRRNSELGFSKIDFVEGVKNPGFGGVFEDDGESDEPF